MKKVFIKFLPILLISIVCLLREEIDYYDIIVVVLLLFNLILCASILNNVDLSKNHSLYNFLSWVFLSIIIFLVRDFNFNFSILILIVLRLILLGVNYYRFNNFYIPQTILGYLWAISLTLYLSELVLNSTYTLENIFVFLGYLSTLETFLIVFKLKKWNKHVKSVFQILK